EAMQALAAILADQRGLACTVKIIDPAGEADGFDAADWKGTTDELIAWAKPRASIFQNPAPQITPAVHPPEQPEESPATQGESAEAGPHEQRPDEPPPAEFPPEATLTR